MAMKVCRWNSVTGRLCGWVWDDNEWSWGQLTRTACPKCRSAWFTWLDATPEIQAAFNLGGRAAVISILKELEPTWRS